MASRDEPFDPYEIGARNSDPELGALQPLPPQLNKFKPMKLLAYFAAGVAVLAVLRGGVGAAGPKVDGSCGKAAFALDKEEVAQYGVLRWSATGPAGSSVVIGVDSTTVPTTLAQGKQAGPTALEKCRAGGLFGVRASVGEHRVTAFLVDASGTATPVSTTKVLVTDP